MKKLLFACLMALSFSFFTGCDSDAYVITDRPVNPVYVRPANPYADGIWIDGDWVWGGGRYTWREGYWSHPRTGRTWVSGSWTARGNGYTWNRGHWRR